MDQLGVASHASPRHYCYAIPYDASGYIDYNAEWEDMGTLAPLRAVAVYTVTTTIVGVKLFSLLVLYLIQIHKDRESWYIDLQQFYNSFITVYNGSYLNIFKYNIFNISQSFVGWYAIPASTGADREESCAPVDEGCPCNEEWEHKCESAGSVAVAVCSIDFFQLREHSLKLWRWW